MTEQTLINRLVNLLENHSSGEWFAVIDDHTSDKERLQIVIHQAARKIKRVVTTRTINGELKACVIG